jgi:hypothetical protein
MRSDNHCINPSPTFHPSPPANPSPPADPSAPLPKLAPETRHGVAFHEI